MKLIVTEHLKQRMREREFTLEDLKFVLTDHDFSAPSKHGGTEMQRAFPDGRVLKVWVAHNLPLPNRVIIKSAAWRNQ